MDTKIVDLLLNATVGDIVIVLFGFLLCVIIGTFYRELIYLFSRVLFRFTWIFQARRLRKEKEAYEKRQWFKP